MKPTHHSRAHIAAVWTILVLLLLNLAAPLYGQTVDAFNPGANGAVYALGVQTDDKIIVGGSFTTLGGQSRANLGRLNSDGTLDTTFNPSASNSVLCLVVQSDGKILVGGTFTNLAGQPRYCLGRINADGTLDPVFNPSATNSVLCLAVQTDGKILVGGTFTNLAGQPCKYLGRLNADGSVDTSFTVGSPAYGNSVNSIVVQPDGNLLIGGSFSTWSGKPRNNLARLNPDGSLDTTFTLAASGTVYSIGLQPDGKILVGGYFSTLGGQTHNNLGRLNADGTLDTSFNASASSSVNSLALQADGKTLVGGNFSTLGGQARNCLGRLNADGTLDTTFNLNAGGSVNSVLLQADGKILLGGNFSTLGGQTRSRMGRINNTEPATQELTFDGMTITWSRSGTSPELWRTTFELSTNGTDWMDLGAGQRGPLGWQRTGLDFPTDACIRARGFVAGGYYNGSSWVLEKTIGALFISSPPVTQLVNVGQAARFSVTAGGLAPLSYQWRKDGTNLSGATTTSLSFSYVQTSHLGNYDVIVSNSSGSVTSAVARLLLYGDSWNPGANGAVLSVVPQADGKILVGGSFTTLGGQPRSNLGRFNPDGTLDATFIPAPGNSVICLAVQTNGQIVLGGNFEWIGQLHQRGIGRLNSDGSLDTGFKLLNPGDKCTVNSLALQVDNAILVGGSFFTLGEQPCTNLGRLYPDGTLDSHFSPSPNGEVKSLALQPDGKILVGGKFTTLCGQARANLGRLNPDGSLDTTFSPGSDSTVYAVVVQPDGKILVGGTFTTLGGQSRVRLGRLYANGTLDLAFTSTANGDVYSLALQTDGKILVGGAFTTLGGQTCNRIGRLYAHGALDPTFNPTANDAVYCLALQPDGEVLAGGYFTSLSGLARSKLGRLNNTGPAVQTLSFGESIVTWFRSGAAPEVWRTTFEASTNGTDWTSLGSGTRIPGGWRLANISLPPGTTLRARGFVTGGDANGSSWFVESILQLAPATPPAIVVNDDAFGFRSSQFGFNLTANPGQVLVVEGSTNLLDWVPLATNLLSTNSFYFTDPQSFPHRFYRARQP